MATATATSNGRREGAASAAPDQIYVDLEGVIAEADDEAINARWIFGRELLKERGASNELPKGRLSAVAKTIGRSRWEVGVRMRFAERFPTEQKRRDAITTYGSWFKITRQGFADTAPKTTKTKKTKGPTKPRATHGGRRLRQLHAEKRAGGKQTNVWELQIAVSQANQLLERFELYDLEWDEHGDVAERLQWTYDDVATMVRFGEQALDVIVANMDELGRQRKLQSLRVRVDDPSSTPAERANAATLVKRLERRMKAPHLSA